MSPASAQFTDAQPIPADVLIEIASRLRPRDQCAMLPCSWMFHDTIAPLVYRRLDVWFQPPGWEESEGVDHVPYQLLRTLAASVRYARISSTRCYARYVVTFGYVSYGRLADLRAAPLLTEFLRFAVRLRHLRVDVLSSSIPLVLDLFRRNSIICTPPPSFDTLYTTAASLSPWILPSLQSVRSSKAAVVEALMRHRGIRNAIIDGSMSSADKDVLLCMSGLLRVSVLSRLSLSIPDSTAFVDIARAISLSFPSLQELSVRTRRGRAEGLFEYLLENFCADHGDLPQLRAVGVNHGSYGDRFVQLLREAETSIQGVGVDRPLLRTVILGEGTWYRSDQYVPWQFSESLSDTVWSWASDVNCGMWGPSAL